jgi:hypothetical protein
MEIDIGFKAALTAAIEHALDKKNKLASHLGCALYADGELIVVTDNTKEMHAEMGALHLFNLFHLFSGGDGDNYYRERSSCRFSLGKGNQGWFDSNVKAVYRLPVISQGLKNTIGVLLD